MYRRLLTALMTLSLAGCYGGYYESESYTQPIYSSGYSSGYVYESYRPVAPVYSAGAVYYSSPRYYSAPRYYAPPPRYYAPPPRYYGPGYGRPGYGRPDYGGRPGYGGGNLNGGGTTAGVATTAAATDTAHRPKVHGPEAAMAPDLAAAGMAIRAEEAVVHAQDHGPADLAVTTAKTAVSAAADTAARVAVIAE